MEKAVLTVGVVLLPNRSRTGETQADADAIQCLVIHNAKLRRIGSKYTIKPILVGSTLNSFGTNQDFERDIKSWLFSKYWPRQILRSFAW